MWEDSAVSIVFLSGADGGGSWELNTRVSNNGAIDVYQLDRITPDGFYLIRHHHVRDDLTYSFRDLLIPVSMAYLERKGPFDDFSKVDYWWTDIESEYIATTTLERALQQLIKARTGKTVFLEELYNSNHVLQVTGLRPESLTKYIQHDRTTIAELAHRESEKKKEGVKNNETSNQ